MRIISLLLIQLPVAIGCFSQDSTETKAQLVNKVLFKGSHTSLSLTPQLVRPAKIDKSYGPYQITTSYMEGIEAGFNYH